MTTNHTVPFSPLACVVLAAGQGTRMRSALPKVLHPVANLPMIRHVLNACAALQSEHICVVVAPDNEAIVQTVAPHRTVVQPKPMGTGDAVKAALPALKDFKGDVMILFGDTPLITPETLRGFQQKKQETGAAIIVGAFTPNDPASYGRIVQDASGGVTAIVETLDATPEQKKIQLCNGGIMLFASDRLQSLLNQITPTNAKGEYYLTDCVGLARKAGLNVAVAPMPCDEILGVNSRVELAQAEKIMQARLRRKVMLGGVTLLDPDTVYLSADTKIAPDVVIGQNVVIGPEVEIAARAEIRAFCHIEKTTIGEGALIGPFARLRPDTIIGEEVHIGNFVEVKKSEIAKGAKINHLSYVGDSFVGAKTNIGAGTITANYDGFHKSRTQIGAGVSIGANTVLVAPVKVGDGASTGAGSVITMEVPSDALAVARGRQANIKDWARRFRESQIKAKE